MIFGIEQGHNILQNILTLQPPVLKVRGKGEKERNAGCSQTQDAA